MKSRQTGMQAHLQVLMDLHTGVVVHAPDTRIVFSNKRASVLLGLTQAQMLGRSAIDPGWHFVDALGMRLEPAQYPVSTVLASGQPLHETDFGVVSPQRTDITWLSVSAFPEVDALGQLARVVINFHDVSERRRARADLERSHAFARAVLDGLAAHICVLDEGGSILAVNKAWAEFHVANGGSPDEVHVGVNYLRVCDATLTPGATPSGAASFGTLLREVLVGKRDGFEWEYACHAAAEQRWFIARVSRMKGVLPLQVVVAHDDVTAVKLAQERMRDSLSFAHRLVEFMQDGFSVLGPDGRASDANPALCRMTGFSREELVGRTAPFPYWPPEERDTIEAAFRKTLACESGDFELTFMRKSGERFPVAVAASAVADDQGRPITFIATVKDITERRRMQGEIQRLAFHDPLTGLPNRRLFDDRLNRAQVAATRSGRYGALLVLDLDSFKALNDAHGHGTGDQLLVEVAGRLKACVRDVDTVARLGGDEFVVIVDEVGTDRLAAVEHAAVVAEKIRAALALPHCPNVDVNGRVRHVEYGCTTSIGVATFGGAGWHAPEALQQADNAMYAAKQAGGNRWRVAEP